MNPILLSLLLGLTAAGANVFGGALIVRRNWDHSYLRYFVALGAGFMLATALTEMVPESLAVGGRWAPFLILAGYLIIHFFEHTVVPHFHFGEETQQERLPGLFSRLWQSFNHPVNLAREAVPNVRDCQKCGTRPFHGHPKAAEVCRTPNS